MDEDQNLQNNNNNNSINYSTDITNAFTAWIIDQRDENLKLVRFHLSGMTLIQIIIWFQEPINCNIPITQWLLISCFLMLVDAIFRVMRIYKIDKFLSEQISMSRIIKSLKKLALIEMVIELAGVGWIIYGEKIFYSDQNTCNWENRHSSTYIMMFLLLTFGMILIFKWVLRLLETTCILIKKLQFWYHTRNDRRGNRQNIENLHFVQQRANLMVAPVQPEIFIISNTINSRTFNNNSHLRRNRQGIIKTFFKLKKTRFDQVKSTGNQCAICLDDMSIEDGQRDLQNDTENLLKPLSLPCDSQRRHAFHEKCLKSWLKYKEECPLCKQKIKPHKVLIKEHNNPNVLRIQHLED
eukprot:403332933